MKKAQRIVRSFRAAHKEYSLLRDFQIEMLGKPVALILHCITRWGSQMGMLNSVLANQRVLERYSQQAHPQIDTNKKKRQTHVLPILQDPIFWQDAARIQRILKPIHEIQYLSEADNYPLYRVLDNWMQIKASMMNLSQERGMEHANLPHIVNTIWDERYLTQITELHVAAYLLNPTNHARTAAGQSPITAFSSIMLWFFREYAPGHEAVCMQGFWAFREQRDGFFPHSNGSIWDLANDLVTFWDTAVPFAPVLATLAVRLMQVPGNSVPGERAWSIMNLILTKRRNSLSNINVDRLIYIYMNERVLNRPVGSRDRKLPYTHGITLTDEEMAALEDLMMANTDPEDVSYSESDNDGEEDIQD